MILNSTRTLFFSLEVQITPTHGEISLGESKFFMCDVVGVAKHVDWYGPSGERIAPNRPDLTVTRNDESSSTLTFYEAKTDSAGTYKCVATNGDQQAEATVKVKIFQRITFTNAPSRQEFTEGDNANIVCDVTSSPPPTVFWKYKGAKIQMEKDVRFKVLSNNHLQIRGIKKTDEGMYMCEARLMARGEIDLRPISVVVNVLPTIRIWQSEVNATAEIAQPATLTCAVDGYPEPMVTWLRNGVELRDEEKYGFNEDGSEMTIMDVTKLDEGEYTCVAKNKAGESEKELSLRVFVKPKITYIVNRTASETEEQVTVTCEASGDPTPTISWSYGEQYSHSLSSEETTPDGNVVVRSDARVSSLTLKYVKYTDAGQYLCTARSAIGEDEQTAYLEVRCEYCIVLTGPLAFFMPAESHSATAQMNQVSMWLFVICQLVQPDSIFGQATKGQLNKRGPEQEEWLVLNFEFNGNPNPPKLEGSVEPKGNSLKVSWLKQDDGGSPILHYLIRYKPIQTSQWKPEIRMPSGSEYVVLRGLDWDTEYDVYVVAENLKGKSPPATMSFRTSAEPEAFPATQGSSSVTYTLVLLISPLVIALLLS
uniref:Neural cell adhesion molecule 1b n=1 Tax=Xiphophorus couchianus TaxID=32473 RepID=A0A3B5LRP4_9TELE